MSSSRIIFFMAYVLIGDVVIHRCDAHLVGLTRIRPGEHYCFPHVLKNHKLSLRKIIGLKNKVSLFLPSVF